LATPSLHTIILSELLHNMLIKIEKDCCEMLTYYDACVRKKYLVAVALFECIM